MCLRWIEEGKFQTAPRGEKWLRAEGFLVFYVLIIFFFVSVGNCSSFVRFELESTWMGLR